MLEGRYRNLVKDLFHAYVRSPSGVKSAEFRVHHEDHLGELDELGDSPYIEEREGCYRVKLLAIAVLKDEEEQARDVFAHCRRVYDILRQAYKKLPTSALTLAQLTEKTGLTAVQIRVALTYLRTSPVHFSGTSDLIESEDIAVIPSESYIRYKTFDDVIGQLVDWAGSSSFAQRSVGTASESSPLFQREISGAPYSQTDDFPTWYNRLPPEIRKLMLEIQFAVKKELSALPSMGLRSVIDCVCNDCVGDIGSFSRKLRALVDAGYITRHNRAILEDALEVGHASVHRAHFPEQSELKLILDIVGHMLHEVYILGQASKALRNSAPKRGQT